VLSIAFAAGATGSIRCADWSFTWFHILWV